MFVCFHQFSLNYSHLYLLSWHVCSSNSQTKHSRYKLKDPWEKQSNHTTLDKKWEVENYWCIYPSIPLTYTNEPPTYKFLRENNANKIERITPYIPCQHKFRRRIKQELQFTWVLQKSSMHSIPKEMTCMNPKHWGKQNESLKIHHKEELGKSSP